MRHQIIETILPIVFQKYNAATRPPFSKYKVAKLQSLLEIHMT